MKRGDLVIIAGIALIALALVVVPLWKGGRAAPEAGKAYAKITVNGELYRLVELTADVREIPIRTKLGYNLLKVHDRGIEMIEADCPDQICITFGFNDRIGKTIVCLPHRVLVEIVGPPDEGGGIDAMVG